MGWGMTKGCRMSTRFIGNNWLSAVVALGTLAVAPAMIAPALAADVAAPAPAYKAAPVVAEKSPWQIRVRALAVLPDDGGKVDQIPGSDLSYSDAYVPELDITYYFTDNFAAELILGVTPHDINGAGSISSLGKIGDVWLLPPTLTLQYHFTNFGAFKPYVGAGINYTIFFDQKADSADQLDVKDTFGWALQAGFDYMIDDHWGFNVDVKKLFLSPDYSVTVAGTQYTGKADLDPWIVGVGVTYRF